MLILRGSVFDRSVRANASPLILRFNPASWLAFAHIPLASIRRKHTYEARVAMNATPGRGRLLAVRRLVSDDRVAAHTATASAVRASAIAALFSQQCHEHGRDYVRSTIPARLRRVRLARWRADDRRFVPCKSWPPASPDTARITQAGRENCFDSPSPWRGWVGGIHQTQNA